MSHNHRPHQQIHHQFPISYLLLRSGGKVVADEYVSATPVDIIKHMAPDKWQKMPYFRQFDKLASADCIVDCVCESPTITKSSFFMAAGNVLRRNAGFKIISLQNNPPFSITHPLPSTYFALLSVDISTSPSPVQSVTCTSLQPLSSGKDAKPITPGLMPVSSILIVIPRPSYFGLDFTNNEAVVMTRGRIWKRMIRVVFVVV